MTKFYLLLIAATAFITSCKTATKSYNKGDYASAIELGVKKLQKDPSDFETKELVKSAYNFAVNQREEAIRSLSKSNTDNRYEAILREYTELQDMYNTIQQSPVAANAVNPRNYSEYVQTYRDKAADIHLENAEKWMDEGTKVAFRNAYNEYRSALRYRDNLVIRTKRDEAYNAAITKVLVVPIQNYGGYSYNSSYQLQQFQNDVMRTLAYNMTDNFVKFFSEWDLQNKDLVPDQILEMNLGRIRLGQPYDEQTKRESTKEVVIKETVYKKDSVVKEYAKVKAVVTTTKRTLLSEGELYLSLRDPKGRTLWTDRFTGQHRWQTEFSTYTGDERALTENDKALLNKSNNNNTPREDEIMNELYRQIQNDLSSRLRNYFSRLY
ncbi:MAG: hypothetical protein EOO10_01125 [Chitinophagaceae bacterium]|nr:MAG: hypothetical protein EOO10_01125 [Chitinophagaceae bacterium]